MEALHWWVMVFGLSSFGLGYLFRGWRPRPMDYKLTVLSDLVKEPQSTSERYGRDGVNYLAMLEHLVVHGLAEHSNGQYVITDEGRLWYADRGTRKTLRKKEG